MRSGVRRVRSRVFSVLLTALAVLLVGTLSGLPAQAKVAAQARSGATGTDAASVAVLDVVMLVDESGSETPDKVAAEKQTAGTIVQTMLNQHSRVTVIGFGGVNAPGTGQSAVDVVCQPTIAGGQANLDYLSGCVGKLHRRSEQEGDDTDYAAALNEAMSFLSPDSTATPASPAGADKVILMMTDGAVDVHRNTQQYGNNWQLGEQTAINQQMSAAKAAGVQLWPLGFGTDVGTNVTQGQAKDYLNNMAASGAPASCDTRQANQPHATWVNQPTDAINAVNELYMDAACLGGGTVSGPASQGLSVNIPAIASSAAISVDRVNPAISVSFLMPDGSAWTDATAISGAAGNSPVEVLHLPDITQADIGTWRVRLTAPPNLASQLVSATVFWQGAVRAIITATPSVKPGQSIAVKLTVLGPTGPITDPGTLKSLRVGVTASGQGLPSPVGIQVTPLTGADNVGTYAGSYTAPSQPTTLTITGIASGYGLYATRFPATVAVGTPTGFFATPHFSGSTSVGAGGTVGGSVDFTNQTGSAKQVLLKLTADGTSATISPSSAISVPSQASGNPPSVPFAVSIDKSAKAGLASLELQVVDASTGQVYNTAADEIQVTTPPPWWKKYLWLLILIALLIIAAVVAALLARKVSRDRKNVRGLAVTLIGGASARALEAPDAKYAEVFSFTIRDRGTAPRLDYPTPGSSADLYHVRRAGRGLVKLTTPMGLRPVELELGGSPQEIEPGLQVAVADTLHPTRRARANRRGTASVPAAAPAAASPGGYQPANGYAPTGGYGGGTNGATGGYTPDPAYSPTASYPAPPAPPPPPAPAPGPAPAAPAPDPTTYNPAAQPAQPTSTPPTTYEPDKWL